MSMIFCRGCGKEIHETAKTCPSCGAPQGSTATDDLTSISDSWRKKFELIEKAGGVKMPNKKNLSFGEILKIRFNIFGFIGGAIYYLYKGMWRKGISLAVVSWVAFFVLDAFHRATGLGGITSLFVYNIIFGSMANIDYYKKIKLSENGWW